MSFYGRYFRFARWAGRIIKPRYTAEAGTAWDGPIVYICHHQNMRGPYATLLNFPVDVHPWVLHVFTERESCYSQFRDYTFSKRKGLPMWLSSLLAGLLGRLIPPLMASMGAIPVYRGTMAAMKTVRQSIRVLMAGEPLIIYPDIEYTDETEEIGEMYEGFLLMERSYWHARKQHLHFIPLHVDHKTRVIRQGEPVLFSRSVPFEQDLKRVSREIKEKMNDMANAST